MTAKRLAVVTPQTPAPIALSEVAYWKLRGLTRDADAVIFVAQAQVQQAVTARDTYLTELRETYPIPATFTEMSWNDETQEFKFT